jgi:hypothetical protein
VKVSLSWLREWANPKANDAELAARLTRAGLECEAEPRYLTSTLGKIVVGEILEVKPHPQADRLRARSTPAPRRRDHRLRRGNARAGESACGCPPKPPDGTGIRCRRAASSRPACCARRRAALAESDGPPGSTPARSRP